VASTGIAATSTTIVAAAGSRKRSAGIITSVRASSRSQEIQ
jgi:hypothetical protein